MPNLKPNFTFYVTNTYVTDSGEGRIELDIKYLYSTETTDSGLANAEYTIATCSFGIGSQNPATANVEEVIYNSLPQYFE